MSNFPAISPLLGDVTRFYVACGNICIECSPADNIDLLYTLAYI